MSLGEYREPSGPFYRRFRSITRLSSEIFSHGSDILSIFSCFNLFGDPELWVLHDPLGFCTVPKVSHRRPEVFGLIHAVELQINHRIVWIIRRSKNSVSTHTQLLPAYGV